VRTHNRRSGGVWGFRSLTCDDADLAAAALIATALGSAWFGTAIAHAEETVNLSELPTIDSMPMCGMEDGSDIDPALLPCVWVNDGASWLTYTDRSYLIIDDMVR
jgi:hypothetical protein